MRRPVNYAQTIATIERATADATDTRSCHEVQTEIVATGSMVPSPGMPRERSGRRHTMLAEQDKKRPTETGLDTDPVETGDGHELGSLEPARSWRSNSISHERARRAMERPVGLELAIRRQLPSLPRSGHSRVDMLMVPPRVPVFSPTSGNVASL
jgi:hypothetical protein